MAGLNQTHQATQAAAEATDKLGSSLSETGKQGEAAHKKLQSETKNTAAGFEQLSNSIKNIAGAVGIGFGIAEIVRFGKEAVNAFGQAQKAQLQLLGSLNGQKDVQERLIAQADKLQEKLGIDNDTIVKQQAFLATQGRTEAQIKKTIDAAVQLSAVTGEDLASSVQKLDATYEGNIGRLGKLDERFKGLSKAQLENGVAIDLVNEKYQGFAEAGAKSVSGQLEIQQRRIDDLTKELGSKLGPVMASIKEDFVQLAVTIVRAFDATDEFGKKFKEAFDLTKAADNSKRSTESIQAEIRGLLKLQETQTGQARTDSIAIIAGLQSIIDERSKAIKESAKSTVETLETLNGKLEDLKKQQAQVADPLGKGKEENDKLVQQIAATQKRIDEITGKAAEDRKKAAETAAKQKEQDEKEAFSRQQELNKKSADESLKIELANLEKAKQEELGAEEHSVQEKLLIDLKYLEGKRKLYEDDAATQAQIDAEEAKIKAEINAQAVKDASDASAAVTKQSDEEAKNVIENEKKKLDAKKEVEKAARDFAINAISDLESFSHNKNVEAINSESDTRIKALEERKNKELENTRLTAKQKKEIEERYQKEEAKIKRDAAVKTRQADKIQAEVNTLLAVTAVLADRTIPTIAKVFAIAGALATGALQVAAISNKPLPTYHTGRLGKNSNREELAVVLESETIFDPETSKKYNPILSAIHKGKLSAGFLNAMASMPSLPAMDLPYVSHHELAAMMALSSNKEIDYDKLAFSLAKQLHELEEKRDFKNRNKNQGIDYNKLSNALKGSYNPRRA